jgi:hypothetical protein
VFDVIPLADFEQSAGQDRMENSSVHLPVGHRQQ